MAKITMSDPVAADPVKTWFEKSKDVPKVLVDHKPFDESRHTIWPSFVSQLTLLLNHLSLSMNIASSSR